MSRPLRLEHAGAVWHVTSRGNERRPVFLDELDRHGWLRLLGRVSVRFGWRLHAYVQMGNHYHLVLETPTPGLSRGMRELNGVYTQAFNRRHARVGHLFQGRFRAVLVERESHLLEVLRYVVLNPVRAGLVDTPSDWRWSSYRATAGEAAAPPWLETSWTLTQAGGRARYRDFVAEGRGVQTVWRGLRGQVYLGSEVFVDAARALAARRQPSVEVPQPQYVGEPMAVEAVLAAALEALGVSRHDLNTHTRLRSVERALIAYTLRRFAAASGVTLAGILHVTVWRASALARAGEDLWPKDPRAADLEAACRRQ